MNIYRVMYDHELLAIMQTARGRLVQEGLGEIQLKRVTQQYTGSSKEIARRKRRGIWTKETGDVLRAEEPFETPYILYPFMTLAGKVYRLHPDEATAVRYRQDRSHTYRGPTIWEWDEKKSAWVEYQ